VKLLVELENSKSNINTVNGICDISSAANKPSIAVTNSFASDSFSTEKLKQAQ